MAAKKGNTYAKGNKGGGRSFFKPEYSEQAYQLTLLGATDKELADSFSVSEKTICNWKKRHKEFFQSLKRGKTIADGNVVNSLYKRAIGYQYDEVHFEKIDLKEKLEEAENSELKIDIFKKKIITKEVLPDVTAQIFWLKNRQSGKWRDKQFTDVKLENLTDEMLDSVINKILTK